MRYDINTVRPIVYLLVSAILDYAVWDDRENAQTELDFLASVLPKAMKSEQNETGGAKE